MTGIVNESTVIKINSDKDLKQLKIDLKGKDTLWIVDCCGVRYKISYLVDEHYIIKIPEMSEIDKEVDSSRSPEQVISFFSKKLAEYNKPQAMMIGIDKNARQQKMVIIDVKSLHNGNIERIESFVNKKLVQDIEKIVKEKRKEIEDIAGNKTIAKDTISSSTVMKYKKDTKQLDMDSWKEDIMFYLSGLIYKNIKNNMGLSSLGIIQVLKDYYITQIVIWKLKKYKDYDKIRLINININRNIKDIIIEEIDKFKKDNFDKKVNIKIYEVQKSNIKNLIAKLIDRFENPTDKVITKTFVKIDTFDENLYIFDKFSTFEFESKAVNIVRAINNSIAMQITNKIQKNVTNGQSIHNHSNVRAFLGLSYCLYNHGGNNLILKMFIDKTPYQTYQKIMEALQKYRDELITTGHKDTIELDNCYIPYKKEDLDKVNLNEVSINISEYLEQKKNKKIVNLYTTTKINKEINNNKNTIKGML